MAQNLLVLVQVESTAAVNCVRDILEVEEVDGVFVGPLDLSASLGRMGEVDCEEVCAMLLWSMAALDRAFLQH